MSITKNSKNNFSKKHIGPTETEVQTMLNTLNCKDLNELVQKTAPAEILNCERLNLPPAINESESLKILNHYSNKNEVFKNYIGMGYYETELPTVIQRNILENPVWLTSYTPYQSEISQGRLQALLNFQTMITELTEMDVANSSLLDEGTATAEAISMAFNNKQNTEANHILIDENIFPQTKEVLSTRAYSMGLKVVTSQVNKNDLNQEIFCSIIQYPDSTGAVYDWEGFCKKAKEKGIITIFIADPLSLCLLKPPGAMGADIVTGSCQRLGIPLFFGGPHAAYITTKEEYVRSLPGRIVGVSKDRHGKKALRLAIQTREQHIRRERATSNICTAQALLAVLSGMYALFHGPEGLKEIATRIHLLAINLADSLKKMNLIKDTTNIFDTVQIELEEEQGKAIYKKLLQHKINIAKITPFSTEAHKIILSFSINETTTTEDIKELISLIRAGLEEIEKTTYTENSQDTFSNSIILPTELIRKSPCLKHPVFQTYHSETQILRYIHQLQEGDLSLTHSMIPLGSCTMKLNATTELIPVSWPEFSKIHPFAPSEQTQGYKQLIEELEQYLCEITGFSAISFQPNAGSQGEYAGLLIIRKYHEERKDTQRKICLIPSSAHGTNPASAVMAGLKPVTIKCDTEGNISHEDLKNKINKYKN